jgi:tetratricopeptide (TPR) repeat protein
MVSTKYITKHISVVLVFLFLGGQLYPQAVSLAAETASLEKKLADSRLSSAERKQTLEKMARLFELSGDAERAADAWSRAAQTVSGNARLEALLQSARCLAAMGEFDQAETALRPVLAVSNNRALQNRARFLAAQIEALKTGNTALLAGLLSNPDFTDQKPQLYFSMWRISGDSAAHTRLLAEFPQSPEARIARNDTAVNTAPAAHWLLSGTSVLPAISGAGNSGGEPSLAVTRSAGNTGAPTLLQTGNFNREENAQNMSEQLRNAGFSPVITRRTVSGENRWIVGVVPGPEPFRTMQRLRELGFDSFQVFGN